MVMVPIAIKTRKSGIGGTGRHLRFRISCRSGVRVRVPYPRPRDSDLSHFGNNPINVSRKVWVASPKKIKQSAVELTQTQMKEVKKTVAQFIKYQRTPKNIGVSPSGKAPDFDSGIRRFKSCHPSHNIL